MKSEQEHNQPKRKFTGWWIPKYVVDLFEQRTINSKELLMLANIDSLANGKDGCFASNGHLGSLVQVGVDRAGQMITHLKQLKLLHDYGFDGRKRYLETYWSRDPTKEITDLPRKKLQTSHVKSSGHIIQGDKTRTKSSKELLGGHGKRGPRTPPSLLDGDGFAIKAGQALLDILIKSESDLVQPPKRIKAETLARYITSLITDRGISKERITKVINWLKLHYDDTHTPQMHKKEHFRDYFRRFEKAMERHNNENGDDDSQEQHCDQDQTREEAVDDIRQQIQNHISQVLDEMNVEVTFEMLDLSKMSQKELNTHLIRMGMRPGSWKPEDFHEEIGKNGVVLSHANNQ